MLRPLAVLTVCAFALSACAGGPNATGVGATSTILPKVKTRGGKKKNKRVAARKVANNCRALNRELRRLEKRRETATAAYDRLITRFVEKNC